MSKLDNFSINVEHINDYAKVTICENRLPEFPEKTYEIGSKKHKDALALEKLKSDKFKILAEKE